MNQNASSMVIVKFLFINPNIEDGRFNLSKTITQRKLVKFMEKVLCMSECAKSFVKFHSGVFLIEQHLMVG